MLNRGPRAGKHQELSLGRSTARKNGDRRRAGSALHRGQVIQSASSIQRAIAAEREPPGSESLHMANPHGGADRGESRKEMTRQTSKCRYAGTVQHLATGTTAVPALVLASQLPSIHATRGSVGKPTRLQPMMVGNEVPSKCRWAWPSVYGPGRRPKIRAGARPARAGSESTPARPGFGAWAAARCWAAQDPPGQLQVNEASSWGSTLR